MSTWSGHAKPVFPRKWNRSKSIARPCPAACASFMLTNPTVLRGLCETGALHCMWRRSCVTGRWKRCLMPKTTPIQAKGQSHELQVEPGQSVGQVTIENKICDILAVCGSCSCAKYHCYLRDARASHWRLPQHPTVVPVAAAAAIRRSSDQAAAAPDLGAVSGRFSRG